MKRKFLKALVSVFASSVFASVCRPVAHAPLSAGSLEVSSVGPGCCSGDSAERSLSDNLPSPERPIDDSFVLEIASEKPVGSFALMGGGWRIRGREASRISLLSALGAGPDALAAKAVFSDGTEEEYRLYCFRDPFGRIFHHPGGPQFAARCANDALFREGRIDRSAHLFNASRISSGDYALSLDGRGFGSFGDGADPISQASGAGPTRTGTYTYNGTLKVENENNVAFPVRGAKVQLWGYKNQTGQWTLIDECVSATTGSFTVYYPYNETYNYIDFRILASGGVNAFVDSNGDPYFLDAYYGAPFLYSFFAYPFVIPYSVPFAQELWALNCVNYCRDYFQYLSNGSNIGGVNILYVDSTDPNAMPYYNGSVIHLPSNTLGHVDGYKHTENFDVLSHEYGHHVTHYTGMYGLRPPAPGNIVITGLYSHRYDINFCDVLYSRFVEHELPGAESLSRARVGGLHAAWDEGWSTFFGHCMQNHFASELSQKTTCCNDQYDYNTGTTTGNYSYCMTSAPTDSCEGIITSYLYNLNDSDSNGPYDFLAISDADLFSICFTNATQTFNEFYLAMIDGGYNANSLSLLASCYGLCPYLSHVSFVLSGSTAAISTTYQDYHSFFEYDSRDLEFFTSNGVYLFSTPMPNTTYILTTAQWNVLTFSSPGTAKVRIRINYASTDLNDYYYSPLFSINLSQGGISL